MCSKTRCNQSLSMNIVRRAKEGRVIEEVADPKLLGNHKTFFNQKKVIKG